MASPVPDKVSLDGQLTKCGGEEGNKSKKKRLVALGTVRQLTRSYSRVVL
eukprot:SAG11_NODE_1907_length_4084_cov_1.378670_3_plen_50_part_00